MKMIDDWRDAYKFWSIRVGALGAALMAVFAIWPDSILIVWNLMPVQVQTILPERLVSIIGITLYAILIVSRLTKQDLKKKRRAHS